MGRAKEYLSTKEHIIHETHLHWILFLESASYTIMAIGISFIAYKYGGTWSKTIHYCSLPFWVYGAVKLLLEWMQHSSADFIVTNNRVIIKVGVLNRSSLSIPLSKIESIEIDQTLMGQMMGYGSIHITGTGTATSKFEYIASPGTFRQKIQHATNILDAGEQNQPEEDSPAEQQENVGKQTPTSYRKRIRRR